jgi:hypothetical protein
MPGCRHGSITFVLYATHSALPTLPWSKMDCLLNESDYKFRWDNCWMQQTGVHEMVVEALLVICLFYLG